VLAQFSLQISSGAQKKVAENVHIEVKPEPWAQIEVSSVGGQRGTGWLGWATLTFVLNSWGSSCCLRGFVKLGQMTVL
jgi:hypothetical protein